jgi:multidrug efflux system membrane fusion protein
MTKLSLGTLLLFASVLLMSCTEGRTADLKPLTPVKVQPAESLSVNNGVRYSATIRPSTQLDLAFKNGGFVESINSVSGRLIEQGDEVAKGTVLARVRLADFEHRLDQANAQLLDARYVLDSAKAKLQDNQARLERADRDFGRAEKLYNSQSLTRSNYDASKAEYDSARAKVESAKADIDSAQSRVRSAEASVADASLALQDTAIVAPMNGTILTRNIEIGSLAAAGKPAFAYADMHSVKAVFGVPDLEIQSVRPGMTLDISSEAVSGRTFRGRVTSVSPAADEKSRIFETEVTIPNPNGLLKAGMIASVVIGSATARQEHIAVPLSAIVRSKDGESYSVYIVENDNGRTLARPRPVKLGDALGNRIVVEEGVSIGDNVITVGTTLVHDGQIVQIVP